VTIEVTPVEDVDITSVALEKYAELKRNYNFVSFEEADKRKKHFVGYLEPHAINDFDFNKEYISFQRDGYSVNPNHAFKGLVFNPHQQPQFTELTEKLG